MSEAKDKPAVNQFLNEKTDQILKRQHINTLEDALRDHRPAVRRGLFAANLSKFRKAAGLSAAALGRELGRTGSHVTKWEAGDVGLAPTEAEQIGLVLGCDPRDLYDSPMFSAPTRPPQDKATPERNADLPQPPLGCHWWRVSGDAMGLAGILHNDLVAVSGWEHPQQGGIVLVAVSLPDGTTWNAVRMRSGGYFVGHSATTFPEPSPDGRRKCCGAGRS